MTGKRYLENQLMELLPSILTKLTKQNFTNTYMCIFCLFYFFIRLSTLLELQNTLLKLMHSIKRKISSQQKYCRRPGYKISVTEKDYKQIKTKRIKADEEKVGLNDCQLKKLNK